MRFPSRPSGPVLSSHNVLEPPHGMLGSSPQMLIRVEGSSGSDMLDYTHGFISAYTEGHFRPQIAQRVTVGAFELLENGLKYGTLSQKVVIELLQGNGYLVVRVSNDAIPARIAMLQEHVQKLRGNAEAVYLEEMRKSMGGAGQRATLGLARVAHEAKLQLFAKVAERNVTVDAACPA